MSNNPVAEALKKVLAESYALYLKTQNYHWNVTGPQFRELHLAFEAQYTDLAEAIDVVAERIRALGEKTPGTFKAFQKLSTITDGDEENDAKTMTRELRDGQLAVVRVLKQAFDLTEKHDDSATGDILNKRILQHETNAWMLSAILGEETAGVQKLKKAS
jgi:starvation-inducible DNA-binding protein